MISRAVRDQTATRWLWLGVAVTAPIFGVSFGHFQLGNFALAPPTLFMLAVFYLGILNYLLRRDVPIREWFPRSYQTIALLLSLFLILHLFSLIQAAWGQSDWLEVWGTKNAAKMVMGFLLFWVTIAFFPREEKFLHLFFLVACASLAVLLAVFIYRYAIHFKLPFLSTEYTTSGRGGKNQMAVQTVFFFFYSFYYFLFSKRKLLALLPVIVIVIAIVYFESRMGWLATFCGTIFTLGYIWRRSQKRGVAIGVQVFLVSFILVTLALIFIGRHTSLTELFVRFTSIYDPSGLSDYHEAALGGHSYQLRGNAIREAFVGFMTSPLVGVGLGNTLSYVGRLTHNDFATVLLEMGLVGEIIFIGILCSIWLKATPPRLSKGKELSWLSVAARGGFITLMVCLNFYNLYLSPYFWFYLALFIVTVETVEGRYETAPLERKPSR